MAIVSLPTKKFRVVHEAFRCEQCGQNVSPTSGGTPRNHCPFCLFSKHVDIQPGDRANPCRGLMQPVGVTTERRRNYVLHHRCQSCGTQTTCKALLDDSSHKDNFDLILELSACPIFLSKTRTLR